MPEETGESSNVSIINGTDWRDSQGNLIAAHEGDIARFNGAFYWYGSSYANNPKGKFDIADGPVWNGVQVYRSTDLRHWTYKGVALSRPENGWGQLGATGRSHVIYNDKTEKYVMWYRWYLHMPASFLMVATADHPEGPFTPLGPREVGTSNGFASDMNVFKDDDGKAYLIYCDHETEATKFADHANGRYAVRIDRLTDDYLDTSKDGVYAFNEGVEAPSMAKFKDKYIAVASGVHGWGSSETVCTVADSPLGPYSKPREISQEKTWDSQVTDLIHLKESDTLVALCDQWWIPDRQDINKSRYLLLPIELDPETGIARMGYKKEWTPLEPAANDHKRTKEQMSPTTEDTTPIQGFESAETDTEAAGKWQPVSDRKIRIGIAGQGVCGFGAAFHFQHHPNVIVAAVADLDPVKRAQLATACSCETTYESCEKLLGDDSLEAIFIATDAPSHARLAIAALQAGKHVASAVPAVFGSLEDADALYEAYRASDRQYMMFETSYFHDDLYRMREMYRSGALGKVIYAEGEYWHYFGTPLAAHGGWRTGLPPQWYPTHSNAYYVGVTGGSFTEVSCMGYPSPIEHLQAQNNHFGNHFGTEIAMFRTSEGGMARMGVSWDTPGVGGEMGRLRTEKGTFYGDFKSGQPDDEPPPVITRPPLPPGVDAGGHGGSHGQLMCEFVEAILQERTPLVDIAQSLNMTVGGIVAHESALRDGELLKIPQYSL